METQPRSQPLRIYLDTSDYSRFADIGYRNEPGIPDTLSFLREKKEQGLIEVRFSAIHLFEFLKDPSQRALALRKVRVMEELCGDRAFRFFADVFRLEREALRSGTAPDSLVISDEGKWFPSVDLDDSSGLDTVIRSIRDKTPMLDAAQIRSLISSPAAAAFLKEKMSRELPLAGVYGSNLVDRFLSNGISGQAMARELLKGFAKPTILIEHYLEGKTDAQEFFSVLARSEQRLHEGLVEAQEKLKPHVEFMLNLDKEIIGEARRYVRKMNFSGSPGPYFESDGLPPHLQEALGKGKFLKEIPATSVHSSVLSAYLRDIIYPSSVLPEIKESDAGDILHATYLPYVDLYRTDGRFGALVNSVSKPNTVKVVPKLLQLPGAIEEELKRRSAGTA